MAINIVTIEGTDSIAASRITLNSNFTEIKDKVDPILDTYDTANGVINISNLPNGQVIAKRLTVTTAGIAVQGGAVTVGSSSDVILNGGNLQLTTGTAEFGGGQTSQGIDLTGTGVLSETGDTEFLGAVINDSNVRNSMFIGVNNTNGSVELQALTKTTQVFLVNDKTDPVAMTIPGGTGLLGNDDLAVSVTLPAKGAAIFKFIIPNGSITGKWWYFGDPANIQQ